jgi:L-alanine-DL-glutamate epimerase-like enolase superfamily enzyme
LLRVPDAPGMGAALDEEAVAFYAEDERAVGVR